jgi:hypothetical protein
VYHAGFRQTTVLHLLEAHDGSLAPFWIAVLPLAVVITVNFMMSLVVFPRLSFPFLATEAWGSTSLGAVAGVWSVIIALATANVALIVGVSALHPAVRPITAARATDTRGLVMGHPSHVDDRAVARKRASWPV